MVAETTSQSLISSEPEAPFSSSKHHDVPIEHLDYVYIGKCSDVKYLEKLLKVLRSGKEGLFPDLIEFAENRLRLLAPSSKLLNAPQPIKKKDALAADEKQSLVDDLNDFVQAMNGDGNFEENGEDAPKPNGDVLVSERDIRDDVPIRGLNCNISEGSKNGPSQGKASNGLSANRIKSGDYRAWDKFDVDAECEKIEQQEQEKIETNRNADTGSKLPSYDVNMENVTDEEVNRRAIIEKEKGNESFRANDFDEAIVYYSRSLRFLESAACFNNRCLAYLKKEQWSAALEDASKVLEMEPDNLKAKLRRSQAHFGLKDFYNARTDVEDVLKHEPSNKNALKVKADIDKANPPPVPGAKRLLIQDCDEDEDEEESEEEAEIVINNHSESSSDNSALTTTAIVGAEEGGDCNVKVSTVPCNDTKSNDIWDTSEVKEEQFFDCSNKTPTPSPPMVPELPTEARKIPKNVLFHKNLANDYFSKGQYHEAMLEYSNAIDKMVAEDRKYFVNAFSALWSNRAACYVKMGDLKQGILDCVEAFTADNKNAKALVRRSNCYAGLERYKEAYVDLKMAISINSSLFPSVQKEYNMYKKYLFDELGSQWERKLPAFNTYGLESQQDKYNKLKLEGNDFVKVGKHDLAIEKYNECIKIDPSKPVAYANRAQCFMSTNRHNEAKKDCDEALELLTSDPDEGLQIKVFYRRCSIQKSLKNYKAALDDLAKVMKARPNNESYSKLFGELMKLHKSHLAETKKATEFSEANKKPQETVKKAPKKVKIVEVEDDDDDDDCDDNDKNEKKTEEDQKVSEGVKGSKVSDVSREKKKSECSAANQEVGASREEKGNNSNHSKITGNEKAKSKSKPESSQSKALPKEAWSESPRHSQNEKINPSDTCSNVPVVPILSSQSPYEFTQAWQSLKGTNDTKAFARLLDQVEDLSKVITVKCDGEMITLLLKVLHDEFSSRSLDCVRHLESLTKLPRFKVIMMFLHQTDKAMVKDCLFNLKSSNAADESLLSRITALEKKFLS